MFLVGAEVPDVTSMTVTEAEELTTGMTEEWVRRGHCGSL